MNSDSTSDKSEYGKAREKVYFLQGDYNGDGRSDIMIYDSRDGSFRVGENYRNEETTDVGFEFKWILYKKLSDSEKEIYLPKESTFGHDRFSGDFNGDGFSDFLIFNREKKEWVLGEVADGNILFKYFASLPYGVNEVTRWLQGDFNGDGRTDVGFYSKNDSSFWVGEAQSDGFNFSKYLDLENISTGDRPDISKLIGGTPGPGAEVQVMNGKSIVTSMNKSAILDYQFDGNFRSWAGEKVFTGNFTGTSFYSRPRAEMLIYKKKNSNRGFYFQYEGNNRNPEFVSNLRGLDIENGNVTILFNGKTRKFKNRDAVFYYVNSLSNKSFNVIYYDSTAFVSEKIADIDDDVSFDLKQNFFLIDDFIEDNKNRKEVLLSAKKDDKPVLLVYENADDYVSVKAESNSGISSNDILNNPGKFVVMSGKVDSKNDSGIVLIDMRNNQHRWYKGTFSPANSQEITLTLSVLPVYENFGRNGYSGSYRIFNRNNNYYITYAQVIGDTQTFREINLSNGNDDLFTVDTGLARFTGDFDHLGNPVLQGEKQLKRIAFHSYNTRLETFEDADAAELSRKDLFDEHYPFQWIQGDYNGDGRTDIGIFHLLERNWYYAMSNNRDTSENVPVPDVIREVKNGIGGSYYFEYIKSSTIDNTGNDDFSDLPMSYLLCSRIEVEDGLGAMPDPTGENKHRIATTYEYKNGFAFSKFINGYKETDFFGFSEFRTYDPTGAWSVSYYNTTPHEDFRKNRALAGAIKESRVVGNDGVEYASTKYEYKIHEISTSHITSYLIEPVEVRKYVKGDLVQTTTSNIVLTPGKYEMVSKNESVTDHYKDEIHLPVTVTGYSEFENVEDSTEMRLSLKKAFDGTKYEVSTNYEYYEENGNLKSQTVEYSGHGLPGADPKVMEYKYDDLGNVIETKNSSGNPARVSTVKYDHRLHQFPVEETAHGPVALTSRYDINYELAFGGVQKKTGPNGNSVYMTFDKYGRVDKQFADTNDGKKKLAEYEYSIKFPMSGKVTQFSGNGQKIENRVYADGMGRTIHSVRSALDEPGKRYVRSGLAVYDHAGRGDSKQSVQLGKR